MDFKHILFVYGFVYGIWFINSSLIHSVDGSLDTPPNSFYVYLSFHNTNIDNSAENSKCFMNYFLSFSKHFSHTRLGSSSWYSMNLLVSSTNVPLLFLCRCLPHAVLDGWSFPFPILANMCALYPIISLNSSLLIYMLGWTFGWFEHQSLYLVLFVSFLQWSFVF